MSDIKKTSEINYDNIEEMLRWAQARKDENRSVYHEGNIPLPTFNEHEETENKEERSPVIDGDFVVEKSTERAPEKSLDASIFAKGKEEDPMDWFMKHGVEEQAFTPLVDDKLETVGGGYDEFGDPTSEGVIRSSQRRLYDPIGEKNSMRGEVTLTNKDNSSSAGAIKGGIINPIGHVVSKVINKKIMRKAFSSLSGIKHVGKAFKYWKVIFATLAIGSVVLHEYNVNHTTHTSTLVAQQETSEMFLWNSYVQDRDNGNIARLANPGIPLSNSVQLRYDALDFQNKHPNQPLPDALNLDVQEGLSPPTTIPKPFARQAAIDFITKASAFENGAEVPWGVKKFKIETSGLDQMSDVALQARVVQAQSLIAGNNNPLLNAALALHSADLTAPNIVLGADSKKVETNAQDISQSDETNITNALRTASTEQNSAVWENATKHMNDPEKPGEMNPKIKALQNIVNKGYTPNVPRDQVNPNQYNLVTSGSGTPTENVAKKVADVGQFMDNTGLKPKNLGQSGLKSPSELAIGADELKKIQDLLSGSQQTQPATKAKKSKLKP